MPELQIAYSVSNFAYNTMKAILIDEDTQYTTNSFVVIEPKEGNLTVRGLNLCRALPRIMLAQCCELEIRGIYNPRSAPLLYNHPLTGA